MSVRALLAAVLAILCTVATTPLASASRMVSITVPSKVLSAFWNDPITMHADVLLPDAYDTDATQQYPALYWFRGFRANYDDVARAAWGDWTRAMAKQHVATIVIFPDAMFRSGYTEFADSANTGPWGTAFTQDLLPAINARYRTRASYVAGFSSGAWAALWLQTTYPALFSGAWAYAPDPVTFKDFTGPDLTKSPPQNFYGNGKTEYRIHRVGGIDRETLRDFVLGANGVIGPEQFFSFNAVFSPADANGRSALFNVKTGDINASVASYREEHYDITSRVLHETPANKKLLTGELHVVVGTWDTSHLDEPTKLFCYALYNVDLHPDCTLVEEADHAGVLHFEGGYENHILHALSALAAHNGLVR